jgi:hypothetical protein
MRGAVVAVGVGLLLSGGCAAEEEHEFSNSGWILGTVVYQPACEREPAEECSARLIRGYRTFGVVDLRGGADACSASTCGFALDGRGGFEIPLSEGRWKIVSPRLRRFGCARAVVLDVSAGDKLKARIVYRGRAACDRH